MTRFRITTSWDDGHPEDVHIADILSEHGFKGTFYIPTRNSEGRPVMTKKQVLQLSGMHEIGGHTDDHVVLKGAAPARSRQQILDNKAWLEDATGKRMLGFCYTRGKQGRALREAVRACDYSYARRTVNLATTLPDDPFQMFTSLQFYPHSKQVLLKDYIRRPFHRDRLRAITALTGSHGLQDQIARLAALSCKTGGLLHIWGHSWEVKEQGMMRDLRLVLRRLAEEYPQAAKLTNAECLGFASVSTVGTEAGAPENYH